MSISSNPLENSAIDMLQMKARLQRPFKLSPIKKIEHKKSLNGEQIKSSSCRSSSVCSIPKKFSTSKNLTNISMIEILSNEKKVIDQCTELLSNFYPRRNDRRKSTMKSVKLKKQLSCCELPIINQRFPQKNFNDSDNNLNRPSISNSISSNDSVKKLKSCKKIISEFDLNKRSSVRKYSDFVKDKKHERKHSDPINNIKPLCKAGFYVPSVKNDITILKSGYIKFDSSIFKGEGKCLAKCDEFELVC